LKKFDFFEQLNWKNFNLYGNIWMRNLTIKMSKKAILASKCSSKEVYSMNERMEVNLCKGYSMSDPKVNIIVQARMGSTRLPGKILLPIMQRPMLSYLIERLRRFEIKNTLIIATTDKKEDDAVASFCKKENVNCYRGNEDDVLDRYYKACLEFPADLIFRITSDCPLLDPSILEKAYKTLAKTQADYVTNTLHRTYPRGMDVELFTFSCLERTINEATSAHEHEHVTPFIYSNPNQFKLENFKMTPDFSSDRLTVDTEEDFELIEKIFEELYPQKNNFTLDDILITLQNHPDWRLINAHIQQKKLYEK
jgi:spore coat polysaccharide biosynthesis protein SpsF